MANLIGDLCIPSELIVPNKPVANGQPETTGQLFLSGGKLYFYNGSAVELVTSA